MIICGSCEHPNESFFKFCLVCGADLSKTGTVGPKPSADSNTDVPADIPSEQDADETSLEDSTHAAPADESANASDIAQESGEFGSEDVAEHSNNEESHEDDENEAGLEKDDDSDEQTGDEVPQGDDSDEDEADENDGSDENEADKDDDLADDEADKDDDTDDDEADLDDDEPDEADEDEADGDDDSDEDEADEADEDEADETTDAVAGDEPSEQVRFMFDPTDSSIPMAPFEPGTGDELEQDLQPCPGCGAAVSKAHSFCGQCGYRFDGASPRRAPTGVVSRVPANAALVVIREDGSDGDHLQLLEGSNVIGRGESTITFASDAFLDQQHCELHIDGPGCTLEDLSSLNGTFVRIVEPTQLNHGDMIRLGQELLRYEHLERVDPVEAPPSDGTELLGAAPGTTVFGRLVQVMSPDLVGNAWSLEAPLVTIGRERGDVIFAGDGYVSGRHATITWRDGHAILEDIGSSNGTYLQIRGPAELLDGDLLLVGQQLLRYERTSQS